MIIIITIIILIVITIIIMIIVIIYTYIRGKAFLGYILNMWKFEVSCRGLTLSEVRYFRNQSMTPPAGKGNNPLGDTDFSTSMIIAYRTSRYGRILLIFVG